MSSLTHYELPSRTARPFPYLDGLAIVAAEADDTQITWNLGDWLASAETVSSAAYEDSGVTTSSKSVSSPSVIFTITGHGYTTVTATTSNNRTKEKKFYVLAPDETEGPEPSDYR